MDNFRDWLTRAAPHEQAPLDLQVGAAGYADPNHQRIQRRQDRRSAPLSFAQQRLWFLSQLEPDCPAYEEPTFIRLHGDVDRELVKSALVALVERHEILRTNFGTTDEGSPVQLINGNQSVDLKIIELGESTGEAQEGELQRLIVRLSEQPIDLSRAPMLRAILVRLAENDHALVVITHRIVFDDWSNELLWREFAALYSAFLKGESCPFPELPIQYADYALWQHRWPQPKILDKQLDYWKKHLEGVPTLQLPTDHPRSSSHSYQGAVRSSFLSKTLSDQLKALSRQEEVTLFVTLLAAFQTLLFRYSGQEDFAVGTPINGRNRAEIQDLIGCFDNKLVLRSDLGGNPTFRELLKRVRVLTLEAYQHHDLPFEKLLQDIKPERNLNQAPLFQVLFALQNIPAQPLKIPGLDVRRGSVNRHIANYDLSLSLQDEPDGLKQSLAYSTDLFEAATMERLLAHYGVLLEGVVAAPDQRILQLPILPREEWHQVGVDWNNTAKPYPGEKCIHSLFEAQARLTPDAVAVVSEVERLTYRDLDERSNRLARYLRNMHVGADIPVGICVDRSIEMMVGILGILKAGGAYLPLDPAYPTERIRFMLEDTKAPVLLTSQRLAVRSPMSFTNVVCLDTDWAEIAAESAMNLPVEETSDKLAYVNYTSGTTGTPKGVLITHRALVNASLAAVFHYDLKESDRVLQFASPSFDVAAEETFPTWLGGGVLVMKPNRMLSIAEFVAFLDREMVSVVNIPTPYWHQWVTELEYFAMAIPRALRLVVVGSDRLSPEKVRVWHKVVGDAVRLINAYGCTEATITTTIFAAMPHGADQALTPVPIGRPISNTKVYILDSALNPVPIGIPGELHIGGEGVARGYLNNPALTADKFIHDPFAGAEHGRLYKTGDLARYLSDGNIELLGRMDTQVKVRGFRIEVEEIEAVLAQHSLVRESVVRAWQDKTNETRLVAYVVLTQPEVSSTDGLRAFLREKLPDYMVPSVITLLTSLPLTPNGKIDRAALPLPETPAAALQAAFVAARTPVETTLTRLWADVLNMARVGVRDNFFDHGGHSLLAVKLIGQIEKVFGKKLPVAALFQAPTVEQFAQLICQDGPPTPWSSLVTLQPNGSKDPFFWIHGEASDGVLARYLGSDQPVYGLRHQGEDGRRIRFITVETIASHYASEIRQVQARGPYLLGGYCFGALVAFEIAHQFSQQGEEIRMLFMLDPDQPKNVLLAPASVPVAAKPTMESSPQRWWSRHLRSLSSLGTPAEKLDYCRTRLIGVAKLVCDSVATPVVKITKKITIEACLKLGYKIPVAFRSSYILAIYGRAVEKYIPSIHPGRLDIVMSAEGGQESQCWSQLAEGGVEIHVVPGDHRSVLKEPYLKHWAGKLKTRLSGLWFTVLDQFWLFEADACQCLLFI